MEKLTIVRSKWLRQPANEPSYLCSAKTGKMCCLGFEAVRQGVPISVITSRGTPWKINAHLPVDSWLLTAERKNSTLAERAIYVNDTPHTTDKRKEAELKKIFAEAGIELTFID